MSVDRPTLESHFAADAKTRTSIRELEVAPAADETRLLTVLFADLSSSVDSTRDLSPEQTATFLNSVLKIMVDAIARYDGRVSRFLGDGVVAYFGTPQAHENDAERAIMAALEIRGGLERLGLTGTAGINTGELYLGRIGSEAHHEFSAQGKAINLAARLQAKAKAGQILVGESTYRLARRGFEFVPHEVALKGFHELVPAFEAIAPAARPGKSRGIEGLRAEICGRDAELVALQEAAAELAESGKAIAIIGEAGVGKSRLIEELKQHALQLQFAAPLWLEGRCVAMGEATSYLPYREALGQLFGFHSNDKGEERERRIVSTTAELAAQGSFSAW